MMNQKVSLTLTYDKEVDAAYLYIADSTTDKVANTFTCDNLPNNVQGDLNIDFDQNGILLGIEILYASKVLPPKLLESHSQR